MLKAVSVRVCCWLTAPLTSRRERLLKDDFDNEWSVYHLSMMLIRPDAEFEALVSQPIDGALTAIGLTNPVLRYLFDRVNVKKLSELVKIDVGQPMCFR